MPTFSTGCTRDKSHLISHHTPVSARLLIGNLAPLGESAEHRSIDPCAHFRTDSAILPMR